MVQSADEVLVVRLFHLLLAELVGTAAVCVALHVAALCQEVGVVEVDGLVLHWGLLFSGDTYQSHKKRAVTVRQPLSWLPLFFSVSVSLSAACSIETAALIARKSRYIETFYGCENFLSLF